MRVESNLKSIHETSEFVCNGRNQRSVPLNVIDESGQEVNFLCSQNTQDMFDDDATFDDKLVWQKIMEDVSPTKFVFQSVGVTQEPQQKLGEEVVQSRLHKDQQITAVTRTILSSIGDNNELFAKFLRDLKFIQHLYLQETLMVNKLPECEIADVFTGTTSNAVEKRIKFY